MSHQNPDNLRTTTQFREANTQSGKVAFEAWCTVYTTPRGEDIFIGAPTLEKLENAWGWISMDKFNAELALHVWIVKAEEKSNG